MAEVYLFISISIDRRFVFAIKLFPFWIIFALTLEEDLSVLK